MRKVNDSPERRVAARDASAYRLNVYHTAIREVQAMSDADWLAGWEAAVVRAGHGMYVEYTPRIIWLDLLRTLAINEAKRLAAAVTSA